MAMSTKRTNLREVNPHLICPLCRGYLIDATTIVECLHSFCRSCILKHLRKDAKCPSCKLLLNTAKPNIKADKALQDIVYKLVPGLYHKEMRKRREFYSKHPEHGFAASLDRLAGADSATPEQRGEDVTGRLIFAPEDAISLSLEYLPVGVDPLVLLSNNNVDAAELANGQIPKQINGTNVASRRYLQCPALVTIAHLKKFLALKYSVDVTRFNIDICHRRAPLPEHWTLMDVAYIFAWKRNAPIRFFYRVTQEEQQLEAPPNDRPSTPGLGASQPATTEEASEPIAEKTPKVDDEFDKEKKPAQVKTHEAKRLLPDKELKVTAEKLTTPLTTGKPEEPAKQVKSPIKIMKKSDGNYQVLRTSSTSSSKPAKSSSPATPAAEFSVVSINDSNESKQVKITLKQCQPGRTPNSDVGSKKPKVISNVLLKNSNDKTNNIVSQLQDIHKQEKHKRKVTFDVDSPTKKQFLNAFSLTAKQDVVSPPTTMNKEAEDDEDANSVEAQLRDIIRNKLNRENGQLSPTISKKDDATKARPAEVKNTNIAERLDAKLANNADKSLTKPSISSSKEQQPIDVYAFPSDPPSMPLKVPPGAVKRKCPPGVAMFDVSKKRQQMGTTGKRSGISTSKGVKCYRNQGKPMIFPKPTPSTPTRVNTTATNTANVNANSPSPNTSVSSTSSNSPSALISDDTRSLLDGCGLNIPASLSITLTSPKSPSRESQPEQRKDPAQTSLDKLNPSITLNDKSVDTRVLKALKAGQMRGVPMANAKSKGRQYAEMPQTQQQPQQQQSPQAQQTLTVKRKKEDTSPQPTKNALDLSGQKKTDFNPSLKIPTPIGPKSKTKPPPPTWSQANSPKSKDDPPSYSGNGQVVTLNSGQRFYRAPPGSLTPAVNRFNDIPAPTRTPVYASCFGSSSSSSPLSSNNLSHIFPSLKSLYALNQAPSLEQFSMDSRMRAIAKETSNKEPTSNTSGNSNSNSSSSNSTKPPVVKSHLAAQCVPLKPVRSSLGSFAVPAKPPSAISIKLASKSLPAISSANESETPANSTEAEQKPQTSDSKEVPVKTDCQQSESCASSTEETSAPKGSDSPRVTSTVSPSPPPSVSEISVPEKTSDESKNSQPSSEVTSTNKSPESPDSSSLVIESNVVDSTKVKSRESSPVKVLETKSEEPTIDVKVKEEKIDEPELKKPMSSETLQKRFLAAFPSNEWADNPIVAEHFGVFLKSLKTKPSEPKPAGAVE